MSNEDTTPPVPADDPGPETPANPAPPPKRSPAARMGVWVGAALIIFIVWYALSDRYAPYASGASAEAYISQIAPRVSGPVTEVLVKDNQEVKAGQALFKIDTTPFEIEVEAAEAQLEQATQTIGASAAGVDSAQAKLAQAEAQLENARSVAARTAELVGRGVYPQSKADEAQAQAPTAAAWSGSDTRVVRRHGSGTAMRTVAMLP